MKPNRAQAFTLVELIIVVSIIGIIIGATSLVFRDILKKSRDDRRLANMQQVITALELYRRAHGQYPVVANYETENDCGDGYDRSRTDGNANGISFLDVLVEEGFLSSEVADPNNTGICSSDEYTYMYQRFAKDTNGSPESNGGYYVLGIRNLDTITTGAHPESPGWPYLGSMTFEWVTGSFDGED